MSKIILITGVPNSGKTRQAELIKPYLNGEIVSWGNIQKESFDDAKEKLFKSIEELLTKNIDHIIVEGFPKYKYEAESLFKYLTDKGIPYFEAVININISRDLAWDRMKSKIHDIDTLSKEFEQEYTNYLIHSRATLEFLYSKSKIFFTVNGSLSTDTIHSDIVSKLEHMVKMPRSIYNKVSESLVPTKYGNFKIIAYQSIINYEVHLAIVKGNVKDKTNVPVRVHSSCITGDILGSQKCDCGDQLHKALEYIESKGLGVVLYLFQEGRGINIVNKLKAYSLQRKGFDTVEANELLGLPAEMRQYDVVIDILNNLGIESIALLTNNPDKVNKLIELGVQIESRIPLEIDPIKDNYKYLKTKSQKMGHILHIKDII